METKGEYLSRQEILDIFAANSSAAAAKKDKEESKTNANLLKPPDCRIWIRNDGCNESLQDNSEKPFYIARVVKDHGPTIDCRLDAEKETDCKEAKFKNGFTIKREQMMEWSDMADKGIRDMIDIDELNHSTILYNLYKNYLRDDIYTYVGPTLLAVNPFKAMDHKFPPEALARYDEITQADLSEILEVQRILPPHSYAISAVAHKQVIATRTKQAIVISGESGAGKTQSAKQCMAFLTSLGAGAAEAGQATVGDKILKTNPVLEAFGNSKTARNDNSSRFGKYVKLYFDPDNGRVIGAETKNYLLEKSRVTGCTDKERNYHVFFFMLRGCEESLAKRLGFVKPDGKRKDFPDFKYMRVCKDLDPEGDKRDYKELSEAFVGLGFTAEEVEAIHRMTAAALHVGDLKLDVSKYSDGKVPTPVAIENRDHLKLIAELLAVPPDELEAEMVNKEKSADPNVAKLGRVPDKPQNVKSTVDSLAKAIFDNLFNWLVLKMNVEILPPALTSQDPSEVERFEEVTKTVGLLDIFGFENFDENQFEQLCINYVNEKLHNLYISSIFGAEKKEMEREGIEIELVLPELKVLDVLKLMDYPGEGLFQLVTDRSTTQMGDADMGKRTKGMYDDICKKHEPKAKVFKKGRKIGETKFTICHSAKDVTYDCKRFIERNADAMSKSLAGLMGTRCSKKISQIYQMKTVPLDEVQEEVAEDPKARRRGPPAAKSIWASFEKQIKGLMDELAEPLIPPALQGGEPEKPQKKAAKAPSGPPCQKCDLHFIRCIKPKPSKHQNFFAHAMTLQQITYMGVLESIKVKQENFPYRKKYEDFYRLYELLSPCFSEGRYDMMSEATRESKRDFNAPKNFKQLSEEIIQRVFSPLDVSEYQAFYKCGRTKILKMAEVRAVLQASRGKASAIYDKYSRMIKRSYTFSKADDEALLRMACIRRLQRAMKKWYTKIQINRADELQKKIHQALIEFKTEKRKDFEKDAAACIEEVYRKHVFREYLNQAIISRQFMMKGIFDLATINRCRKMWICRRAIMRIVDRSLKIGLQKKQTDAAYRIQRILRGHMERNNKEDIIMEAVKSKVQLKQKVSAKKIQKHLRCLIVIRRMAFLNKTVSKIQASMRMKWTRRIYQVITKNVRFLQKAFRRYMARRDQVKIRLYNFLTQELQVLENVKAMEYAQLHGNLVTRQQAEQMGLLKTLTPYSIKKIHFFKRVIDLSILVDLSEVYSSPWSAQWLKATTECTMNDSPIMDLSAGNSHTMIVNSKSKVYVWGWNDNGQCAKPVEEETMQMDINRGSLRSAQVNLDGCIDKDKQQQIQNQGGFRLKQSIAVQDRCICLIQETQELVVWGANQKGQLGLGHYEDVNEPTKIETFSKNGIKITYVAAGGYLNLACSEDGDAFAWPFTQNGMKQSLPTRMPFSEKTRIQKVSCGSNFGFFISQQGLVYSFGEDNSDGQLGLGHTYPTEYPELIQCFKDIGERIDTIECGYRHAIAKSSLGKIYTWGSSNKGQLGHDHLHSELSPRYLQIDRKNNKKVVQIAAGYSHCIVMMEHNKEIYWFGTCGTLEHQKFPIQVDFAKYLPDLFGPNIQENQPQFNQAASGSQQLDFAIVKVDCSWSTTMSISNLLIADLRAVNQEQGHQKLMSTLHHLNTKWDQRDIMPPYVEVISGMFPANIMRKPQAGGPGSKGGKSGASQKMAMSSMKKSFKR